MTNPIPFAISVHGETVEIPISGALITGKVRVIKTDGNGVPIPGVKFAVYNSNGQMLEELTTGLDGAALSGNLTLGDYYLLETEAAAGYAPVTEQIPFSITTNGEVVQKTVVNSLGAGTLRIAAQGESDIPGAYIPLSGAAFDVYRDADNGLAGTLTTGAMGTAEQSLPLGSYHVIQTQTATGYELSQDSYSFSLAVHGASYDLTVLNELTPPLGNGSLYTVTLVVSSTLTVTLVLTELGLYPLGACSSSK